MSIVLAGFFLGLSLIVAVGPQNAMLLKFGIRRDHIGLIIAVCALSDVILITSGTAGVGYLVEKFPNALQVLKYVGAAYLAYFTFTCFRDALKTKGEAIEVESTQPKVPQEVATFDGSTSRSTTKTKTRVEIKRSPSWVKPLLTALALTWLNPGAYVDVVVMLGQPIRRIRALAFRRGCYLRQLHLVPLHRLWRCTFFPCVVPTHGMALDQLRYRRHHDWPNAQVAPALGAGAR